MAEVQYIALLRGINVGGNNIIKMADLKKCFEEAGFNKVKTYIQSGNVLFTSNEKNKNLLIKKLEKLLSAKFNYQSRLVIITDNELKTVVEESPSGFGNSPDQYRYDVLFVKEPLTSAEAIKSIDKKEGVDQVFLGSHALYFARLISKASQSHLPKIIKLPIYQNITIRNWNTTTKLLAMSCEA